MLRRLAVALVLSTLGAAGCSDPVAPPAQGGLYIQIGSAVDKPQGTQCPSTGHSKNIGAPPPDQNSPGGRVVDGEGGQVFCNVSGGDPFSFNGKLAQGNISFTVKGTVAPQGTGSAQVIYYDPDLATTVQSPNDRPCTVAVNSGSLQVASGRVWASFACDQLIREPSSYCGASGVFVFENCDE